MQIKLNRSKIKRPKPKYRITQQMLELRRKSIKLGNFLSRKLSRFLKDKPYFDRKIIDKYLAKNYPKEIREFEMLVTELNKEEFKEAYNENLADVEYKAFEGDKNAWLKLLRWDISYLEYEQLRKNIYEEHTWKSNNEDDIYSSFLEEIAHIISHPKLFHRNVKIDDYYAWFIMHYDKNKTWDENKVEMQRYFDEEIEFDERQLRRIGLKKK